MAKHIVKCKYCGIQFDTVQEPWVEVSPRRYAHKSCAEKYDTSIPQDEKDYKELEDYIKKIFKLDNVGATIKKQIKKFKEEYNYTYSGMKKTLFWWYEIQKHPLLDSYTGIGIVPYIYDEALKYYYGIWLANQLNQNIINYHTKEVIIEIASPRTKTKELNLFEIN